MISKLLEKYKSEYFLVYVLKFLSLGLRFLIALLFVTILVDSDFNLYLKISTISGFGLSFLLIHFQNIVLNNANEKINSFVPIILTSFVFLIIFIFTFLISHDFILSIYVLIYSFVPLCYFISQTQILEGNRIKGILYENLLQNIVFLTIFLIIYFLNNIETSGYIKLNILLFNVFLSWLIVCFTARKLLLTNLDINFNFIKDSYNSNNLTIVCNTILIYILTKIDLIIFFISDENLSLKDYYSTQKFGEIIGLSCEIIWIIFASKIKFAFKSNNQKIKPLIFKYNLYNFISILIIGCGIFLVVFLLNNFTSFNYVSNYKFLLIFLVIYAISSLLNIYFQLLLLHKKNKYILASLLITLFVVLLEFIFIKVDIISKMIIMISSYLILSKLLMYYFYTFNLKKFDGQF